MESSDSIDKSWDTTSDTTTTAMRSDPLASEEQPTSTPGGWMVNVAGRDVVEMSHADVVSRWRNGELLGNTLVWREGMENWARLESVPAFQIISKPAAEEEPTVTEDTNAVAVYERPMATLIFDEAVVEDEWKGTKASEPSKAVRASEPSKGTRSASARPPAPELPPLAPRRSPVVPVDEPPPPPPLPPRRSLSPGRPSARPPMPTIPGGLAPPSPRPPSVAPAKSTFPPAGAAASKTSSPPPTAQPRNSPIPAGPPSSPLLAAIAAAASSPEPIVVAASPAAPPVAPILDEVSVSARLRAMRSVSLRNAVLACAGSALVASLVTGLVVGSRSRDAARRAPEPPAKVVAAAPVAPTPPVPAPAPTPAEAPKTEAPKADAPESTSVEKVALSELAEKPKPKPVKVSTWKAPKPATPAEQDSSRDGPAPNPNRDDPERAVPDRVDARPAQPANWQADPGF